MVKTTQTYICDICDKETSPVLLNRDVTLRLLTGKDADNISRNLGDFCSNCTKEISLELETLMKKYFHKWMHNRGPKSHIEDAANAEKLANGCGDK